MTNRYDTPYKIEADVETDPEIQFILQRIDELKAQQSDAMPAPFNFSDEATQRSYNDFALQLQINALQDYVEKQCLEVRVGS